MNERQKESRESAEQALRHRDWTCAFHYWGDLVEEGAPDAAEWLARIEGAALRHAEGGDREAQAVLGTIGTLRYTSGGSADVDALCKGLRWLVAAVRQEPADVAIDMLVFWYRAVRGAGVRDPEIEELLREPLICERYRQLRGSAPLAD